MITRAQKILKMGKEAYDLKAPGSTLPRNPDNDWDRSTYTEDKTSGSEYIPDTLSSVENSKLLLWNDDSKREIQNYNRLQHLEEPNEFQMLWGDGVNNNASANIEIISPGEKVEQWLENTAGTIGEVEENGNKIDKLSDISEPSSHSAIKQNKNNKNDKIRIIQDVKFSNGVLVDQVESIGNKSESKITDVQFDNTDEKNNLDEDKNIKICVAERKDNGKRLRNKTHSCYFCTKMFINMARHFEKCHGNEIAIAKILAKEKKSKSRKESFAEVIRAGDFNHNCDVLAMDKGELVLVRRPTESEAKGLTYTDYGPCPHCLGFMLKKHLWHHVKNCPQRGNKDLECNLNKNIVAESNAILYQIFGKDLSSSFIQNIVSKIRDDDVGKCVVNDSLILSFGAMLYEKYDTTQCELIRQSMRQLGRLLLSLRDLNHGINTPLSDFLRPDKFDMVVQATKILCVNQVEIQKRPEFAVPSLALKIGYALKKCISIERGKALKQMNLSKDQVLKSFLHVMEFEWSIRISSNALSTLYKRKMNKTDLLPLTNDLVKLNEFISTNIVKYQQFLEKDRTIEDWQNLACYTLGRIILFNKRRSGEASRMTLKNYTSKPDWSLQTTMETKNSMTPFERKLIEKFTMVEIEGKRGRKVPVILTPETKVSIDLLIKHRDICGFSKENPFIFALGKNSLASMRGHDCLSKICRNAGLENAHLINGTKLRKYVATVCQIFNLSENEYDWLARHLGHDIRVHREFYRLHESAIELTKVSRLLMAVDSGQASKFSGKTLQEINVEDLSIMELDEGENVNESDGKEDDGQEKQNIEELSEELENNIIERKNEEAKNKDRVKEVTKSKQRSIHKPVPWSREEKECVIKYFYRQIKQGTTPGKNDCLQCISQHSSILSGRDWTKIKFCIKNEISKRNRMKK